MTTTATTALGIRGDLARLAERVAQLEDRCAHLLDVLHHAQLVCFHGRAMGGDQRQMWEATSIAGALHCFCCGGAFFSFDPAMPRFCPECPGGPGGGWAPQGPQAGTKEE